MKNKLLLINLFISSVFVTKAANFFAKPGGGDWNSSSTWTVLGGADADGIPDSDDAVSIGAGITVTVSQNNQQSAAINIASGGTLTFNNVDVFTSGGLVTVNGTINGTFSGATSSFIKGTNSNGFAGTGNISITGNLRFNCNAYIQAGVIVNNIGNIIIGDNAGAGYFVGNYGNIILNDGTVDGTVSSSQFQCLTNSFLTVNNQLFPTAGNAVTNASYCTNNTITFDGNASYNTRISVFQNIIIRGSGAKTLSNSGTTSIFKNLTIDPGATLLQSTSQNLILNGSFLNNGTFTGSTKPFTFNGASFSNNGTFVHSNIIYFSGSSPKTISGNGSTTFSSVNLQNAGLTNTSSGVVTFTGQLQTISQNFNHTSGTLIISGFYLSTSGGTFTANTIGNTVIINYNNSIPAATSGYYNLTIGGAAGTKRLPGNTIVLNNLTINTNSTLNTNNFDLVVGGNWVKNGNFTASAGKTVTFNGLSAQTISGTGTTTFKRLTINNSAGVSITSGTYNLDEVLTVSNGVFNNGSSNFTLTSSASQTARIAPITTGSISGNFIVQRFITARDTTWSILSSPVQSTTMQDWDNELFIYYSTDPNLATVQSYDETVADYVPVSSSATNISPMQGFEVYLTADVNLNSIGNITLNTIGVPNFGDQSLPLNYTDGTGYEGQNLVGNPFASSIDWSTVYSASSNIDTYADVYDYTTGNYANVNPGDEIGSSQGFWVYALGAGATLNIPESAKTTSSNSSLRKVETPVFNLSIASADGSHTYAHKLELLGDMSYSNQKDANDRPYRMSPNKKAPKITSIIDGKEFVRNAFNSDAAVVNLPLLVSVGLDGKYSISAQNIEALAGGYTCIILKDNKLNQTINLNEAGSYTYIATTKDAKDRFELELSKNGNCRTAIATNNVNINDQVLVLPTVNGNSITFNFTETLNTTISVTNMLGQSIVEQFNVQANTQTIELGIPEDFSGMYIVTISNEKGNISKKFVKK